jgi:hypothetical protein
METLRRPGRPAWVFGVAGLVGTAGLGIVVMTLSPKRPSPEPARGMDSSGTPTSAAPVSTPAPALLPSAGVTEPDPGAAAASGGTASSLAQRRAKPVSTRRSELPEPARRPASRSHDIIDPWAK